MISDELNPLNMDSFQGLSAKWILRYINACSLQRVKHLKVIPITSLYYKLGLYKDVGRLAGKGTNSALM